MVSLPQVRTIKPTPVRFGWVSLFQDMGSKMVVPMLPLFLVVEFGASAFTVAAIDGAGVVAAALIAPTAGRLAHRHSPVRLTQLGYSASTIAKGALALAWSPLSVLAVRAVDRGGKGLRDAPRDLLLVGNRRAGRSMGIQQAMDKTGGVIGPLVGLAVFSWFGGSFDAVFLAALVPCVVSVALLIGLEDPPAVPASADLGVAAGRSGQERVAAWLLGVQAAATVSSSLLILAAFSVSGSTTTVLLAFAGLRAATALGSVPAGLVADRFSPWIVVGAGAALWGFSLLIAVAGPMHWPYLVLPMVGLAEACVKGPSKVLVASLADPSQRGVALGRLSSMVGWSGLIGALATGATWGERGQLPITFAAVLNILVAMALVSQNGKSVTRRPRCR